MSTAPTRRMSPQEYLAQKHRALVERYVRQGDVSWLLTVFEGLSAAFAFSSIPVRIPMAEIFSRVVFPEAQAKVG